MCSHFVLCVILSVIYRILRVLCEKLKLSGAFDFAALARQTPGYVGADLAALTGAAGIIAVKRMFQGLSDGTLVLPPDDEEMELGGDTTMFFDPPLADTQSLALTPPISAPAPIASTDGTIPPFSALAANSLHSIARFLATHPSPLSPSQLSPLSITPSDFTSALKQVQPSSLREGFTTIPSVTWSSVGALHHIRAELSMSIVQPIKRPELFASIGGGGRGMGVLLWGPPGCGKTMLAKACANESRANFISVKGPELLNKVSFTSSTE